MKKLLLVLSSIIITATLWAQTPEKFSYQAVVRDSEGKLVSSQEVGVQISVLEGTIYGASLYVETQTATTNENGLVSIEIGSEDADVLFGDFSDIDWSDGTFILKTETDPEGGTNYTIVGTSQLLSVPYALHAKTAESISENFTVTETDPLFTDSYAADITAMHILTLDNTSGTNTGDEDLSDLATKSAVQDTAAAIRATMATLGSGSGSVTEADPIFAASDAADITAAHITVLGNTTGINTGDQDLSTYAKTTDLASYAEIADVLTSDNTTAFTPDADYEPATKKYVDDNAPTKYEIGDFAQGGVVFWVDETGQNGLVCAKDDQSDGMAWSGAEIDTWAKGDGLYSGEGNTFIIITVSAAVTAVSDVDPAMPEDDPSNNAAKICGDLQEPDGTTTYGDWYLPSAKELKLMFDNKAAVDAAASSNGGTALATEAYWSSTESNTTNAKVVDLSSGTTGLQVKISSLARVRAIRAF